MVQYDKVAKGYFILCAKETVGSTSAQDLVMSLSTFHVDEDSLSSARSLSEKTKGGGRDENAKFKKKPILADTCREFWETVSY